MLSMTSCMRPLSITSRPGRRLLLTPLGGWPGWLNLGLEAAVESRLYDFFWCMRFSGPKLLKAADFGRPAKRNLGSAIKRRSSFIVPFA